MCGKIIFFRSRDVVSKEQDLIYLIAVVALLAAALSGAALLLVAKLGKKTDYAINTVINAQAETLASLFDHATPYGRVQPDVVVSMTTIRNRLDLVHVAVQSIVFQSVRPRVITLYLSDEISEAEIPANLERLARFGLKIRFVRDVGPHTKLIYALHDFPTDRIITVDDDIYYPSNMIETLLKTHERYPHAIVGNWAREIPFRRNGTVDCIKKGKLLTPTTLCTDVDQKANKAKPGFRVYPYGTGGVLYPPGALDPQVQDVELFTRLCPTEDDVWFKAMALLKGTPTAPTNLGIKPKHHNVRGSQIVALRHQNYLAKRQQSQLQAVMNHFGLLARIRELEAAG